MTSDSCVLFVLPSTRIGGGNLEILRLAGELQARGTEVHVVSLWKHENTFDRFDIAGIPNLQIDYLTNKLPRKGRALLDIPSFLLQYPKYLRTLQRLAPRKKLRIILTHYSTLLFGLFTGRDTTYCFIQDEEWLFVPNGPVRWLLRWFILTICRRYKVITTNPYITYQMHSVGVSPVTEASIWASWEFFNESMSKNRTIDVVMLLRKGYVKRLDLYMQLLAMAKETGRFTCGVITCEDDIAKDAQVYADVCLLRPSSEEMKVLFQSSKIYVLFSEREGFGLPPLEAMGSGCVPICRDSGGVRCYMTGALEENLIPLDAALDVAIRMVEALLKDESRLQVLSQEAHRIFRTGYQASKINRSQALATLSAESHYS